MEDVSIFYDIKNNLRSDMGRILFCLFLEDAIIKRLKKV